MPTYRFLSGLFMTLPAVVLNATDMSEAAIIASGDLTPIYNSTDPWDVGGALTVGNNAPATLRIDGASVVNNTDGFLASYSSAIGEITVNGSEAAWNNSGRLLVGRVGTGTINIENGGTVTNQSFAYLGQTAAATGTINVVGTGSSWNSIGELHIGHLGTGILNVEDGATVSNGGDGFLGFHAGSSGTATITGTGSVWDNSGDLVVGNSGTGALNILNGGVVNNTDGYILGGPAAGSVTVNGAGSVWNNQADLFVGFHASGTLYIENGGKVFCESSVIGFLNDQGTTIGTVTVTGDGSAWEVSENLYVGETDIGILHINDGGAVTVGEKTIPGLGAGATGLIHFDNGTLNTGSLLASPGELSGTGTIHTNGLVSDIDLVFDSITGLQQQFVLSSIPGQNITIHVDASSPIDNKTLGAGYRGTGTMTITDGQAVSSGEGFLGYHIGSTGSATVSGNGSVWQNAGNVSVGQYGAGTLNIENGGKVYAGYSILSNYEGSSGTATVTGAGSLWENTGSLGIGNAGPGTLNVENGGTVTNANGFISSSVGSSATATISGVGSAWFNYGDLRVGSQGTGSLIIEHGGAVSSIDGYMGYSSGASGTSTIAGFGSAWDISEDLHIGYRGSGTLNIENGGIVNSATGYLGSSVGGGLYTSSGISNVTGHGSVWNNSGSLYLGNQGNGTLNIEDGGTVNNLDSYFGYYDINASGAVTVTGDGSTWNNNGPMTLGRFGAGTLTIGDGGVVNIDGALTVAERSGSTATINLGGGILDLHGHDVYWNTVGGAVTFNFTGGTLRNASKVSIGQPFVQEGGTLAPGGPIGTTRISGDYMLTAGTIEIEMGGIGNPIDYVLVSAGGDAEIATQGTTLNLRALGNMHAGTYTLMESTAGTITGMFETINPLNLFGVNVTVLNTGTAITVTLGDDLIFADPNLDGFVGIADLNIVLGNWNQSVTTGDISLGDLNGDGFVGIDDLNAVLGHWNASSPPPPEVLARVPEPTGAGYMLLVAISACRRCRARSA